ncbi:TonB-dependent receptor domain-containing protein [Chondrinema litorale]|uniref:TonB-dependent receptor domain-containing protein n=1 Tax=Chondrinema litorale TaxID=2994555 RepID=UPI00254393F4|nr:TonB-dependent receptor [Chondrinema litorale]UZR98394.1 TonB-dependent receptor [Chondrinema litorale]
MCKPLFFCFLLFITSVAYSQTTIKGKLTDATENSPIEYGSLAIYQSNDSSLVGGSISNDNGDFIIKDINAGNYYLIAKFLGFEPVKIENLLVSKDQNIQLGTIALVPNQQFLNEIEISGKKVTATHKIDRQVFQASLFESGKGGTATDILRNMPSVSVNAQGVISVRGSTGFVVMINGKPVQTSPETILNQLPANAIDNIEIITAPSAKYDPEGKAGMINIITKQGATDGLYLLVNGKVGLPSIQNYNNAENASRYGGDFTLNFRKKDWDISVGTSYSRNDLAGRREGNVYTIIDDTLTTFPSDGERSFDETSYSGRFSIAYTPNKNNAFNLGFYAGKRSKDRTADILYYDNNAQNISTGNRIYTYQYFNENLRIRKGDFVLGSIDYSHKFENSSTLSTSLLYEYTMLGGPTTNKNLSWPNTTEIVQEEYNTNDNPLKGFRFQLDYKTAKLPIGVLEMGYQFRNLDHTGDFVYERKNLETGIFELVPEFSSSVNLQRILHSAYSQLSGSKGKFEYQAGLRIEMMDRALYLKDKLGLIDSTYNYDFVKLYPSASLLYQVNSNLKLKAAYSKRVERTTTFKMNPFPEREHSETFEQGDPELKPEFIDLLETGIIYDFGDNSIFLNAYFRNVENLVNRVNTIYNDTILNRIYSNVGRARTIGAELGTELNPYNWLKIFAGFNIYKSNIKGAFDNRPIDRSSWMYNINGNANFGIARNWRIQFSINYLSKQLTAQGEDSKYLVPNLSIRKTFLDERLTATLQWLNIDMGLWEANEQRITTWRDNEFYTTTNYVYEVDMLILNLSYTLNKSNNKAKFIKSEFGEKEF